MRISNNAYPYQTPARRTGTTSGAPGRTSFGEQLDIAANRREDQLEIGSAGAVWQVPGTMEPSPYLRLMYAYDDWKIKQPPQELPDSRGATEENLAYLKERYSGDLSWEERVDALETMAQLGVITEDQKFDALGVCGGPSININDWDEAKKILTGEMEKAMEEYRAYGRGGWDACFQDRPIGTFKRADDLFVWLDKILENKV